MRAEDHLSGSSDVCRVGGTWWVAHVKPSQEKRLAQELATKGVDFYLPLVRRNSKQFGVMKKVWSPFIPGYLFFSGGDNQRYDVITTHRTVGIISISDQVRFIRELSAVQKAIEINPALMLLPKIPVGTLVKITGGPFMGNKGIVENLREDKTTVLVSLRLVEVRASYELEIEAENVEPL